MIFEKLRLLVMIEGFLFFRKGAFLIVQLLTNENKRLDPLAEGAQKRAKTKKVGTL